jgi:lauroyl/myristoyl acyltransferase
MDAYLAFRALGAIAPRLPARWGYAVAGWLADLAHARNIEAVRGLRDNIRHAMGASASAAQVDETVRRAYRILLLGYWDMFRLPVWTVEQLRAIVQIVGWETVEKARALGGWATDRRHEWCAGPGAGRAYSTGAIVSFPR